MSKTTAELRESVAEHLRISTADLTLSAEDADLIDRRIQAVTDYLRELGVAWWVDNAIPDAALMPMTLCVSAWACVPFGKAGQGYEAGFPDGKTQLASIKPSSVNNTVQAEYL